ncbi:MAG: hypothetical protein ACRD4K_00385, partial [Candidatus Acidiferrales bacterium]
KERRKLFFCRSGKIARGWPASAAILVLSAAVAAGPGPNDGDPWNQKPYTEWTLTDVLRVTQNSPWAHSLANNGTLAPQQPVQRLAFDDSPRVPWPGANGQGMNASVPVQIPNTSISPLIAANPSLKDAVVLWSSSATIREAYVRMAMLEHKLEEKQDQTQLLEPNRSDFYRITVMASHIPAMLASYHGQLENALKKSVYLKSDARAEKVYPAKIEAALNTAQPMINFYSPRTLKGTPVVDPRAETVQFDWTSKSGEISVTFEVHKMLRNGSPDL